MAPPSLFPVPLGHYLLKIKGGSMSIYGRYEKINPATNTKKFWWIVLNQSTQEVMATWGRIGNSSPAPKYYSITEATKKVREKLKKGYVKVDGYTEKIGSQAIHFIKEFCSG